MSNRPMVRRRPFRRPQPRHRGVAMLLVIIAVAMVTVLSLSFLSAQSTTTGITRNLSRVAQARQIASSAIAMGMAQIQADSEWRSSLTHGVWFFDESLEGGTVTLLGRDGIDLNGDGIPDGDGDLTDDPTDPVTLTATATFQGVTQTIHAVVRQSGGEQQVGLTTEFFLATRSLSNLSHTDWNATPDYVSTAEQVNQPRLDSSGEAWPGGPRDEFAVRYSGRITIPVSGQYTFWTDSDDGSDLWIDGVRVVNNDDLHSMRLRSGSIQLTAGTHDFVARYFEWYGDFGMIVSWQGPGMSSRQVIPPEAFTQGISAAPAGDTPLLVSTSITLSNNAHIAAWSGSSDDDDEGSAGSIPLAHINAISSGSVSMSGNTRINGNVNIGPNGNPSVAVSLSNNAAIDGSVSAMTVAMPIAAASMPTGLPANQGNASWNSSQVINTNRHYGNLTISGNSNITIQGDVTIACTGNFVIANNARIDVNPGAKLTIYVGGNMTISNNARILSDAADPTRCQIIMTGNNRDLSMDTNSRMWAQVRAPSSRLVVSNNGRFYGTFVGRALSANTNARVNIAMNLVGETPQDSGTGPASYALDWLD